MEALPTEDTADTLKNVEFAVDALPAQRSLGLSWDLQSDSFTLQVSHEEKAYTRRGVLSTLHSVCDPLGFVTPITIQGKAIIRDLSSEHHEWDSPLPPEKETE